MGGIFAAAFWKAAGERAIRTFAQALVAVWGGDEVFSLFDVDWGASLSVGAGAAVLSVLMSVATGAVTADSRAGGTETPRGQIVRR